MCVCAQVCAYIGVCCSMCACMYVFVHMVSNWILMDFDAFLGMRKV